MSTENCIRYLTMSLANSFLPSASTREKVAPYCKCTSRCSSLQYVVTLISLDNTFRGRQNRLGYIFRRSLQVQHCRIIRPRQNERNTKARTAALNAWQHITVQSQIIRVTTEQRKLLNSTSAIFRYIYEFKIFQPHVAPSGTNRRNHSGIHLLNT